MEEETKKETKKFFKKWWFGLGICIVMVSLLFAVINQNNDVAENVSTKDFTSLEIKKYLQKKGYTVVAKKNDTSKYIYIYKDKIYLQKIDNVYLGTIYCWRNLNVNGEWADILNNTENKKDVEIEQYNEYLKWLNEINLNKSQIIDVLDYCYKNMEFEEFIISSDNKTSSETTDDNLISSSTSNGTTNSNSSSNSMTSGTTNSNSSSNSTTTGTTNSNTSSSSTTSGITNSNSSSSSTTSGTTNSNTSSSSTSSGTSNSNTSGSITTSQQNALKRAKEYISIMPFSKEGLISQLEYEKFSYADASYGAENCGANWNEQALKKAKAYLNTMAFSYQGLISQLEYDKFTNAQATYGASNCGANWNEQAAKKAKSYLSLMSFSREGLISQLQYDKFTYEQAVYGVEANGL